jgi:hypothetical protein
MLDLGRTFLQSVERSPNALALVDGELKLTYGQWHRIILDVADGLCQLGLARGDRLLVVLQNRWEMATLHWACQFAGIVIVPLNWRAKLDELDYCVSDAGVKAIAYEPVCADAVVRSRAAQDVPRIGLDDAPGRTTIFDALLVERERSEDTTHAGADDYSLILYTSGTTGKAGAERISVSGERECEGRALPYREENTAALGENWRQRRATRSRILRSVRIADLFKRITRSAELLAQNRLASRALRSWDAGTANLDEAASCLG